MRLLQRKYFFLPGPMAGTLGEMECIFRARGRETLFTR